MKASTYVISDIHGRIDALREVLALSRYNNDCDCLIILGDVCDRAPGVRETIDLLLTIKNIVLVKGNHDISALKWMDRGIESPDWLYDGGKWTIQSYYYDHKKVPQSHKAVLRNALPYYELEGSLFVHAGFDPTKPVNEQEIEFLAWDREIISYAEKQEIPGYKRVFIGHTPTEAISEKAEPAFISNLIMIDCGAGHSGRLCMMNIDDLSYVLSTKQESP